MNKRRTGDKRLTYIEGGNGESAIVFVHGFGCDSSDWDAQMAHLEAKYRVLALDLPGHGASLPSALATIESLAAAVTIVRQVVGRQRTILVGHSMSARVVLEAYRQNPADIVGVVLVDGSRVGPSGSMDPVSLMRLQLSTLGARMLLLKLFDGMFQDESGDLKRRALTRLAAIPNEFTEGILLSLATWDRDRGDAVLKSLRVPLLLICSTYLDLVVGRRSLTDRRDSPWIDYVTRMVGGVDVEVIRGTRHFPQVEAPAATNRALARFADRITRFDE
jgi:pimeloyl-ACP methyl ester carboxylesterase